MGGAWRVDLTRRTPDYAPLPAQAGASSSAELPTDCQRVMPARAAVFKGVTVVHLPHAGQPDAHRNARSSTPRRLSHCFRALLAAPAVALVGHLLPLRLFFRALLDAPAVALYCCASLPMRILSLAALSLRMFYLRLSLPHSS